MPPADVKRYEYCTVTLYGYLTYPTLHKADRIKTICYFHYHYCYRRAIAIAAIHSYIYYSFYFPPFSFTPYNSRPPLQRHQLSPPSNSNSNSNSQPQPYFPHYSHLSQPPHPPICSRQISDSDKGSCWTGAALMSICRTIVVQYRSLRRNQAAIE
jgi:hypothetical protein